MIKDINNVGLKFYSISNLNREDKLFLEKTYEEELLDIGHYLNTLSKQGNWSTKKFKQIRKKVYGFLFRDGFLWKRLKKGIGMS
ncbi:hypothetical protein GCM10010495_82770 [Kitasatospora herbaricolor]|nr:hypothetical protein GCM10010495_82770 [Kitasatospora herbaricolor]